MTENFEMVAKTFLGLEDVLAAELIELGAHNVQEGNRMVSFEGDLAMLYKANLCCRTALRILKPLVKFVAADTDELYDKVRDLPWEQFIDVDKTFSIDATVNGSEFTQSRFVTYRVKDAIADHFNDLCGKRPSVSVTSPDIRINVHIAGERVTLSIDSSGEPLYKRGYRVAQTDAPINEVLAAGIILKTGWRGDCDFVDPMCGSGTFLIEAALIACNINPGIYRESFAFEKWKDFDADLFEEIYNDDSGERDFSYMIRGGDIDPEAVKTALRNVKSAKVDDIVKVECKSVTDWEENEPEGVLVTNPPYGERLKPENIKALYRNIGTTLKKNFSGWHAWIIGYRDDHFAEIGLKPSMKIELLNGSLECSLREYVMFNGKYSEFRADGGSVANPAAAQKQGPKKVRHISDDDWNASSRKFNKSKGKGLAYNPENSKPRRPADKGRGENSPRGNSDRSFGRGSSDRPFKPKGDSDRSFGRGSSDRPFKPKSNSDRERASKQKGGGVVYDPSRSKGPSIPESKQQIINPVHFRKRKNSKNQ